VTERYDRRYTLAGNLLKGDVSLTIMNAEEADSGIYCCRVEISGWFNDQTSNHKVVIEKGECKVVPLCEYRWGKSAVESGFQSLWWK